jgi:hypothetical protein
MDMAAIRKIAQDKGVANPAGNKMDLVRQIQQKEGNSPCFATAKGRCDQVSCLWLKDCLEPPVMAKPPAACPVLKAEPKPAVTAAPAPRAEAKPPESAPPGAFKGKKLRRK